MDVPVLERTFIDDIKRLIEDARLNTYAAINAVMLETYWNIGKRIVEQEQQGKNIPNYKKNAQIFFCGDRKSTRLNSSHTDSSRMPSSA